MKNLSRALLEQSRPDLPADLVVGPLNRFPVKVLQFGEGNFLRGFADWMINRLNTAGCFNGSIAVVQPRGGDKIPLFKEQDGLYTLLLRGIENGSVVDTKEIITVISRCLEIYTEYDEYLKLAESPELRVIVSNTTEAGIIYSSQDRFDDAPPVSFPGKLTVLLHRRFKAFGGDVSKGFIIMPCELIERNGDNLREIVLRLAQEWGLGEDFTAWISEANYFLNTLVDRIVTGYPKDELEALTGELGYTDKLLDAGEVFHLWVLEGDKKLAEELPFAKAGINAIWTNDITPYRTRKVRILNGAHTMTVPAAFLYGLDTVGECVGNELISTFMKKGIFDEIIPTLDMPADELGQFANIVLERFANPFIKHYLLSISLNSVSKFKTRVLPSILEYVNREGKLPKILTFSLAALFAFYRGAEMKGRALVGDRKGSRYEINDDLPVLEFFRQQWSGYDSATERAGQQPPVQQEQSGYEGIKEQSGQKEWSGYDSATELVGQQEQSVHEGIKQRAGQKENHEQKEKLARMVSELLARSDWWGRDLNEIDGLTGLVADYLFDIVSFGMEKSLKALISEGHAQEKSKVLVINEKDNVAVAIEDVVKGERLVFQGDEITALEDIDKGHKVAVRDIALNEDVIKYGYPIGHSVKPIAAGEYVHTHNIRTNLEGKFKYSYNPRFADPAGTAGHTSLSRGKPVEKFMGYVRSDGNVGIRNEIWIVNTVGCVNKTSEILSREANIRFGNRTDGIFAFPHPYGCSQMGDDLLNTQRILAAMVRHPNAAGVLVLGLGCENNNIPEFKKLLGNYDPDRVKFLTAQEAGDEIEEGLKLIGELVGYAERFRRQECPVSRLVVGLKCGGSDAFSGITANPLVGAFSDLLIKQGGTAVLTEVPEMFGAETILMNRCISNEVFDRTVELINGFKEYYIGHGQVIYDNPSPGNKKGGISTLEEKSLGCTQKGGTGNVTDVLDYGETVRKSGLNLLKGPGNDMVAATVLAAAGAQLILFTTGRGTPLGAPVPTVKISTNTDLFKRKSSWIDFDAGQLLEDRGMGHLSEAFFEYVMKVASGEYRTKNEINGYSEIAIFKDGVTL